MTNASARMWLWPLALRLRGVWFALTHRPGEPLLVRETTGVVAMVIPLPGPSFHVTRWPPLAAERTP